MNYYDILDSIARSAGQNIERSDEDYEVDGILYCHKCNTPKQVEVELMGRKLKPLCLCKCEAERREREDREREHTERITILRKDGFPDPDMQEWRFECDDRLNPKLSDLCRRYAKHFDEMRERGKGLLLFGGVGTGKTFIAACIANDLIDREIPCFVTNFSRLVNTMTGMFDGKQEFLDSLNRYDLLVIDDLASERDTEYMNEIVMNIIDQRYRSGKPLIVTTNLSGEELKNPADIRKQRIYSRLFEMCVPFEVKGEDRRKIKLRNDYDELSEILGLKEIRQ